MRAWVYIYFFSSYHMCINSIEIHMPANMFKTYIFEPSRDLYEIFFLAKKSCHLSHCHQVLDSTELTGRSKSKSKGGPEKGGRFHRFAMWSDVARQTYKPVASPTLKLLKDDNFYLKLYKRSKVIKLI